MLFPPSPSNAANNLLDFAVGDRPDAVVGNNLLVKVALNDGVFALNLHEQRLWLHVDYEVPLHDVLRDRNVDLHLVERLRPDVPVVASAVACREGKRIYITFFVFAPPTVRTRTQ